MRKAALIHRISAAAGLPAYVVRGVLRAYVREVQAAVERRDSVTLHGLGTFRQVRVGSRVVYDFAGRPHATRNWKISFRPSRTFRRRAGG